jgi:hypothetical protein
MREGEENWGTFRSFRKEAGLFGPYQKRMLLLMGFYWITASFFLILPFYFFKRPVYCQNIQPHPVSNTHIYQKPTLYTTLLPKAKITSKLYKQIKSVYVNTS